MLTRGVNSAGLAFTYAYVPTAGDDRYPDQNWTADPSVRRAVAQRP